MKSFTEALEILLNHSQTIVLDKQEKEVSVKDICIEYDKSYDQENIIRRGDYSVF
jgi:hypothetical protein